MKMVETIFFTVQGRLTRSHVTACYAFADIVLVIFGYILACSKGLNMGEMAGIGFLGILGLLSV